MSEAVLPLDHRQREAALDTARSFIVRAPAGSGKTRLLIQRYLALLARVAEPEEVVAITFTRKAAAEMRHRVLTALADAASGKSTGDPVTHALAAAVHAQDARRGWQLDAHALRLRITTIDALNASLTRQMPVVTRFGAQPESVDDAGPLYREAARALMQRLDDGSEVAAALATLLAHLDNNRPAVESLIADMLAVRDHWMPRLRALDARQALEKALAHARAKGARRARGLFPAALEAETLALARLAGQNLARDGVDAGLSRRDAGLAFPGGGNADVDDWQCLAALFLTRDGTLRKRGGLDKRCGIPPGTDAASKAQAKDAKDRMGALLEAVAAVPGLEAALAALAGLPPATYSETQWRALSAIVALLPHAAAELWQVFGASGRCDFIQVAQAAASALGSDEAPTELALALDHRIGHLLVDEFQDTSVAQVELLAKLTRGWAPDDGRTLFLVGDPMQSIYRFRGAEVTLFQQVLAEGIGGVPLEPLALSVNFRSGAGVVDWVNEVFPVLMTGGIAYAPCSAHDARPSAGPAVHLHAFARDPDDKAPARRAEAARVVERVRAARAGDPSGRIAILVRNRPHLADIVPALKAAGIAFQAVDIDPLADRPVVRDLLAITRALLHPADRIAWLAVLRAPWCGLTLNDLAALMGTDEAPGGVLAPDQRLPWDIVRDEARLSRLSPDGRARLAHLAEKLGAALDQRRRVPLRELAESLWLALDGPAALATPADHADAATLLALIEDEALAQSGGSDIPDLAALEARVAVLYARPASPPPDEVPVQVLTIHKAKGLEWDTVIVPGIDRLPRQDERRLLVWAEDPSAGEAGLLLAPILESGDDGSDDEDAVLRYVRAELRERQREEDVRLLYVAATRARRALHWLATLGVKDGAPAAPRSGSLLAGLWPALGASFAAALETPAASVNVATGEANDGALRLPWPRPAMPSRPHVLLPPGRAAMRASRQEIEFDWAGDDARHVGTVVHAYLEAIAADGLAAWSAARVAAALPRIQGRLAALGVAAGAQEAAARRVQAALVATLADPRGQWILSPHRDARSEWRLSGQSGDLAIDVAVDRSFVDEAGTRWIIDFKTGSHEGGNSEAFFDSERERYRQQLEGYATLVRALSPGNTQPLRLGLYFPLMGGWREWAAG